MEKTIQGWRSDQKTLFRFFFLLLGGSTILCWDVFSDLIFRYLRPGYNFYAFLYGFLQKPFYWLDRYIYHTGYNPKLHAAFPGDNHFGVVFYLTLLLFAMISTISWTLLDRKRSEYNRLLYWFRVYIRYLLAITMLAMALIN